MHSLTLGKHELYNGTSITMWGKQIQVVGLPYNTQTQLVLGGGFGTRLTAMVFNTHYLPETCFSGLFHQVFMAFSHLLTLEYFACKMWSVAVATYFLSIPYCNKAGKMEFASIYSHHQKANTKLVVQ